MEMYAKMVTDIVTKSAVSAQLQEQRNKNGGIYFDISEVNIIEWISFKKCEREESYELGSFAVNTETG